MTNPDTYKSPHKNPKSSSVDKVAAFTRAVKALRGSENALTLPAVARRAASYLPGESSSVLLLELRDFDEVQLREIRYRT